jgi:hypothetical protein
MVKSGDNVAWIGAKFKRGIDSSLHKLVQIHMNGVGPSVEEKGDKSQETNYGLWHHRITQRNSEAVAQARRMQE